MKSTYDEDARLFQDFRFMELASDVTGAFWIGSAERDQGQLNQKMKYDEWEQTQCDMQVDWIQHAPKIQSESEPLQQANTFTVASILLPKMPWAAYAGIGIVNIHKDLMTDPLQTFEEGQKREATLHEDRHEENQRQLDVDGAYGRHRRYIRPRRIKFAIDNQAVVKGFRRIKDG